MAERWEIMNQISRPMDEAMGVALDAMKKVGVYDPFRSKLYETVRAFQRKNFKTNNDLEVEGLENIPAEGGAILACNHSSWLDVQLIVAALERRVHFVAKAMFEDWPFLRHMIAMSDSVFIRRGGDSEGMKEVVDALQSGKLIGIFPEGTIPGEEDIPRWDVQEKTGLLKGKTGAVRLAMMAGVPIIPVGISGAGCALPVEVYPRMQEMPPKEKVKVTVRFGKPITFEQKYEESTREDFRKLTDYLMRQISKLVDHERGYMPITLPYKRKTKPDAIPHYALRSAPRKAKKKAKVGVLVVHGFTSHIACVAPIEKLLKERKLPYRFPILRGHGTRPEDMVGVTHRDWYEDAENALLDLLQECEKAIVIGHSMGGLVTLELAARHHHKLAGAIAASPALRFADPLAFATPMMSKVVKFWPSPKAYYDKDLEKANNQNYKKFAMDAMGSLYEYAQEVGNLLSFVRAPIAILMPRKDQVVAPKAANIVHDRVSSKDKQLVWFEKSGHEMYLDLEADAIVEETGRQIDRFLGM